MKRNCYFAIILVVACFSLSACFLDHNNDVRKLLEKEKIPKEMIEQAKIEKPYIIEHYTITQDDLEQTIKIIIEDDIWFHVDKSDFYTYINKDIEFEYYYDQEGDNLFVMPLIEPSRITTYIVMRIDILEGRLIKSFSSYGTTILDETRAMYLPEITGSGTVSIGEIRKPQYDATEEEIAYAIKNVKTELETYRVIGGLSERENVYIRNFYRGSEKTFMLYTYNGTHKGLNISVETGRQSGSKPYEIENQEYVKRLQECSIAVEKEEPLDKEAENALEAMIKQKTEQSLKTLIDDDIWFKNEKSLFYSYRNKEIAYQHYYEYYYNKKSGYVDAFPIIEFEGQAVFCEILFSIKNDILGEGVFYDNEQLSSYELENIQGSGTVSIGERRKPPYDADEDEVEMVKENIRKYVEHCIETKIYWKKELEDIYIRNFYQGAIDTMMIYTYEGERYYTYINTNGEYHKGKDEIEESQKEYYDRLIECSFPLYD